VDRARIAIAVDPEIGLGEAPSAAGWPTRPGVEALGVLAHDVGNARAGWAGTDERRT
jgi:hypothetical protein